MSDTFRLSGDVPDVRFELLHRALASLGWAVRVHDDFRLHVGADGVELEVEKASRTEHGFDFLIMGALAGTQQAAVQSLHRIARALDEAGVVYLLELDDENEVDDDTKVVLRHPQFPKGRYAGE